MSYSADHAQAHSNFVFFLSWLNPIVSIMTSSASDAAAERADLWSRSPEECRRDLEQQEKASSADAVEKFREFRQAYDKMIQLPAHVDDWMAASLPKEELEDAQQLFGLNLPYQPDARLRCKIWEYCDVRLPLTTSALIGVPLGTLSHAQLRQIPGLRLPKGEHGLSNWQHYMPLVPIADERFLHLRRRVLLPFLASTTHPIVRIGHETISVLQTCN